MVTRWGMSVRLGPVTLAPRDDAFLNTPEAAFGMGQRPYSEATAQGIDAEVERILQEGYQQALKLLREHRDPLDRLARALVERETLEEQQILEVTGLPRAPQLDGAPRPREVIAAPGGPPTTT
jgi:cell division protease FtsH